MQFYSNVGTNLKIHSFPKHTSSFEFIHNHFMRTLFAIVENEFFLYLTLKYVFVRVFFSFFFNIPLCQWFYLFLAAIFFSILWFFLETFFLFFLVCFPSNKIVPFDKWENGGEIKKINCWSSHGTSVLFFNFVKYMVWQ